MSGFDSGLKMAVFVGLFASVAITIVSGTMLEDSGGAGGTLLAADAGGGAMGIHAAFAGLVGLLMLTHIFLNRQMFIFHLSHSLGLKGKK